MKTEIIPTEMPKPTKFPTLVTRESGCVALATSPTTGVLLYSPDPRQKRIGEQMRCDEGVTWENSPKNWYCIYEPVTLTLHTP